MFCTLLCLLSSSLSYGNYTLITHSTPVKISWDNGLWRIIIERRRPSMSSYLRSTTKVLSISFSYDCFKRMNVFWWILIKFILIAIPYWFNSSSGHLIEKKGLTLVSTLHHTSTCMFADPEHIPGRGGGPRDNYVCSEGMGHEAYFQLLCELKFFWIFCHIVYTLR